MALIFTKEQEWLEKWDQFVSDNNASHLVYSDWLKSYESYGFDFEIGIFVDNEKIIGGYGAVIPKIAFLKFYILPYGPIVLKENRSIWEELILAIKKRSNEIKSCYCQIALPYSEKNQIEKIQRDFLEHLNFKKGNYFKYVFSFAGLNWIDLRKYKSAEEVLMDFKSSVRRDIRNASRKDSTIEYFSKPEQIELAYKVCQENANRANYPIRDWQDVKETIFALIEKQNAKFIVASKDGEIKGAIFIIKTGKYYTYIFGGTKKEKPDLLTGHLLQWEAIKLSLLENCVGYNISLGGSKGVREFKNGFNTNEILNENSKYYFINNRILFFIYISLEKYVKPYKGRIAGILRSVKNKK